MTQKDGTPPQLISKTDCDASLNFQPISHWPRGLPGVAIRSIIIAGFEQNLILNHDFQGPEFHRQTIELFTSLHPDLSWTEWARLQSLWSLNSKNLNWFPMEELVAKSPFRWNAQTEKVIESFLKLPIGFQNWCAMKKISAGDLLPLTAANSLGLEPLLFQIINMNLSKSQGVQALEWGIELLLMGRTNEELLLKIPHEKSAAEAWLFNLKCLRFPQTTTKDQRAEKNISKLPWPQASQIKWIRQGDKAGIEVKLFVSAPHDFQKFADSFEKIQDVLNKDTEELGGLWKSH